MNTLHAQNLPRSQILKGKVEIGKVRSAPPVVAGGLKVYYTRASRREAGFFVPVRIGGAVLRNKYKRWMREIYRRMKGDFLLGKLIFQLRRKRDRDQLGKDFRLAARKLGSDGE